MLILDAFDTSEYTHELRPCKKRTVILRGMKMKQDFSIRTLDGLLANGKIGDYVIENPSGDLTMVPLSVFDNHYEWVFNSNHEDNSSAFHGLTSYDKKCNIISDVFLSMREIRPMTIESKLNNEIETSTSDTSLNVDDLLNAKQIIEIACSRSAFHPSEYEMVGNVYRKLTEFFNQGNTHE